MKNRVTEIFGIEYPIISGGMVWCSGWELAAAVSNAGGLGLIGSGSMEPEVLREHIRKCKAATDKPFGVNLPLMFGDEPRVKVILEEGGVSAVFTSAGSPKKWTETFKAAGIKVAHVVASSTFALKSQDAGVDAVVVEGFEAGGHNGREETTSMVLAQTVSKVLEVPMILAGGIATGGSVLAAFAMGAEGVQIGTRFALSSESSGSIEFKNRCLNLPEGDTMLCMKSAGSVRMVKNSIYSRIHQAEYNGATKEELFELTGRGRAKMGIFEADQEEGFVEIGQVTSAVGKIESVADIFEDIKNEYNSSLKNIATL